MHYETLRYRRELRDDVVALHATHFRGDAATSARYIRWKYEESPYFEEPPLYLAAAGGRIVGMRGAYATMWSLPHAEHPIVLPCLGDTIVDPAHTSRGVFAAIMELALSDLSRLGHPYALNLSATPVTLLNSLATGWRAVGRPRVLHRRSFRRRTRDHAASIPALRRSYRRLHHADSGDAATGPGSDPFARFDASAATRHDEMELTGSPLPEAMAALAAEIDAGDRIRAACDARYLRWRFADPLTAHRFAFQRDERGLAAYVVIRGVAGHPRVVVVDWQARSPDLLRRLLSAALAAGRWPEAVVWSGPSGDDELAPFRRAGFVETPVARAAAVLVRRTGSSHEEWLLDGIDLLDEAAWQLRLLQSESGLVDAPVKPARPSGLLPMRSGRGRRNDDAKERVEVVS